MVFLSIVLFLSGTSLHAADYIFGYSATDTEPNILPAGCTGSGGIYACAGAIALGDGDTVTIVSPTTITMAAAFGTAGNNEININGVPSDLTLIVIGAISLGTNTTINANITCDVAAHIGANSILTGSITTVAGAITTAVNVQVIGDMTTTAGAVTLGEDGIVTGDITSSSGAISVGAGGNVNGNMITGVAGAIKTEANVIVNGTISTFGGAITIGTGGSVTGDMTSTNAGAIVVAANSEVRGNLTTYSGAITVGAMSKVTGDVITKLAGAITLGAGGSVIGSVGTKTSGAITIGADAQVSVQVYSTQQFPITLGDNADIGSVCCKVGMDATCVSKPAALPMPPICTPAPVYQNSYTCGVFGSVLTTYEYISSGAGHPANNDQACYTGTISYPEDTTQGLGFGGQEITCSPNGCGGNVACNRVDPPVNYLEYTVSLSALAGTTEGHPSGTLENLDYGDFNGNFDLTLNPKTTYGSDNTPVMRLGDVTLTGSNTLTLAPGDYHFQSLTFTKNNPSIVLSAGGSVRIFIEKNLTVAKNGLNINATGIPDNLFIYIRGDLEALTNGAIEIWKAFFYIEGTAKLDANSNKMAIYGGITAEGPIVIEGNNGSFYQQGSADDLGYGACTMCYADIIVDNASLDTFNCTDASDFKVPIYSSNRVSHVTVDEAHQDSRFAFIDTNDVLDTNDVVIANATDVNKVITYPLGNSYGPANKSNYYQLHSSSMFSTVNTCSWNQSLAYLAHYDDGNKHYDAQLSLCKVNPFTPYTTGPFNAWDTFRDNVIVPPSDRNISTKIVNQPFQLSLASLNKANDTYETKYGVGSDIDVSIYAGTSLIPISNSIVFDANSTSHVGLSADFTVTKADKNAFVGFKMCATYEDNTTLGENIYYLYPNVSCTGTAIVDCDVTTNGTPSWHICYASDNFAIRPDEFTFDVQGVSPHVSGRDYNLSFFAKDIANVPTEDYNESVGDSFSVDINETKVGCLTGSFNPGLNSIWNFSDGGKTVQSNYNEVGVINIKVQEINGSEYALVDQDDTSDLLRFITPYDANVTFAPEHFNISATLTPGGNNFTYISNDLNMSLTLDANITAKTENNITTTNYNSACYAQSTDYVISHNVLNIMPVGSLSRILYQESNTFTDGNISITEDITLSALPNTIFSTDTNGTGKIQIKINFDRDLMKVVEPFDLNIQDINVTDTNNVKGTIDFNQNAIFYYGRVHAPDYSFTGNNAIAMVSYEVYSSGSIATRYSMAIIGNESADSIHWYVNTLHVANTSGEYNPLNVKAQSNTTITHPMLKSMQLTAAAPHKDKIIMEPNSWLVYDKVNNATKTSDFLVEFFEVGGSWSGQGTLGGTIDLNVSTKQNKRLNW